MFVLEFTQIAISQKYIQPQLRVYGQCRVASVKITAYSFLSHAFHESRRFILGWVKL